MPAELGCWLEECSVRSNSELVTQLPVTCEFLRCAAVFVILPPSLPAAPQMNKVSLHPSEIKKLGKNLIQVGRPASGCLL